MLVSTPVNSEQHDLCRQCGLPDFNYFVRKTGNMESLLLRALESTLRHWLKTFSRDQFKLRGRSVQLYDLDVNGDVLHASIGLPPTLRVTEARVGKLELKIPSLSNVNKDPIVVELDKLELVLTETVPTDRGPPTPGTPASTSSSKSSSYGYADKLADGMTISVTTVNLMLETRGGRSSSKGGAAWTPPLASITMRNLMLYTTNEHWKVVPLNHARDFNNHSKSIYVFKKLEWQSLSVDLLPHPDMFTDELLMSPGNGDSKRDRDGAKRLFFGGERFLDSISGVANITIKRSEQNINLGLEVQLHIPEVLCPALSEPGLRALLRFMTGIYVCMNRGDVDVRATQSDAAGQTMVGVSVDHIFLCIKDAEFQLEFLLQSLQYVRASNNDGDCKRTMSRIVLGCLFLRDTFSHPSCTLVQPSMRTAGPTVAPAIPSFASDKLWPRIYPLESEVIPQTEVTPMVCMYAVQTAPAPAPPNLASQTVIQCQPLKINLQEESCLRIASFLSDGVVVEPGMVLPDTSLNAMYFSLKELDLTVPLNTALLDEDEAEESSFTGARLHVEGFMVAQSPYLNFKLLNLDKDAACFAMWKGQPVDSSQQRWVMRATHLSIALETGSCDDTSQNMTAADWAAGLWRCVEMYEPCLEAAMSTADGHPLIVVPPPGGIVRLGIACRKYVSNTSSEQFLFVLKMYTYLGKVSDSLLRVCKPVTRKGKSTDSQKSSHSSKNLSREESLKGLAEIVPGDSAVFVSLEVLELKLLESVPGQVASEGPPLIQFLSWDIRFTATYQSLTAAAVMSSNLYWRDILVECVETELSFSAPLGSQYGSPLTHVSGVRDSFTTSSLGSPLHSPAASPGGDSIEGLAGLAMRPFPLKLSPLLARSDVYEPRQGLPEMRAVFWIGEERGSMAPTGRFLTGGGPVAGRLPFLDVSVEHVIPFRGEECHSLKVVAKVGGVRLGGGMAYNEALLHRFGVLGPDGGPGPEVKKVIKSLSRGSVANLFRPSPDVGTGRKGEQGTSSAGEQTWDVGLPDDIELELQLLDWLFALEGTDGVAEPEGTPAKKDLYMSREDRCWHSTFRCLTVQARGTKESSNQAADSGTKSNPVQRVIMRIEGLQALKPRLLLDTVTPTRMAVSEGSVTSSMEFLECVDTDFVYSDRRTSVSYQNGVNFASNIIGLEDFDIGLNTNNPQMRQESTSKEVSSAANPNVTSKSGFDVEVQLVEREDDGDIDMGMGEWMVESCKAAVIEPIEVEATKQEVEYMVELFKSELESASRIVAGGLKLLQLHETIGQSVIDQLSHFGSGSLNRVLTPDSSRRFSEGSFVPTPSLRRSFRKESTVSKLEASVAESQSVCAKLNQQVSWITDSATAAELKALTEQLKHSQTLLGILKSELYS